MNPLTEIRAVVALLVLLFFGEQYIEGRGYDRAKAEDQAAANQLKAAAAAKLANAIVNTRAAEQALQDFKNTQDLKDADYGKIVSDLSYRLRHAAGPAGRLRDPHAAGCGGGSGGATGQTSAATGGGAANPAEAGGLLSTDLSGLLQRLQLEADTINVAYASCRADTYTVRGIPLPRVNNRD